MRYNMITFVHGKDASSIHKHFLKLLNTAWCDNDFVKIIQIIFQIDTNQFMTKEMKTDIKRLYYCNIKLLNIVRKITLNKHIPNKIPINRESIFLEPTCLIKSTRIVDIASNVNLNFYRFDIQELIKIFDNAVFNHNYEFSDPILPKNPYTNINFSNKDFYIIYNTIKYKTNSIPLSITLLNLSYYNLSILSNKFTLLLCKKAISTFVNNLSNKKFYKKLSEMLGKFNITTCIVCLKKIPIHRIIFTDILKEYIYLLNTRDKNYIGITTNIVDFLSKYNILNINTSVHNLTHRNIKKYKRHRLFTNQVDLDIIKESNELFIFKSDKNKDTLNKLNLKKYNATKRRARYKLRNKRHKSINTIDSNYHRNTNLNDINYIIENITRIEINYEIFSTNAAINDISNVIRNQNNIRTTRARI